MNVLGLNVKRFNRSTFFLSTFLSMFLFVAVGLVISMIIGAIFGPFDPSDPSLPHPAGLVPLMVLWYIYLVVCIVKRLHDLNVHSAWATGVIIGSFVPFANLALAIWLLFVVGTEGANDYGDPQKKTKIMGLSF